MENNAIFGEVIFNMGWEAKATLEFFGKSHNIIVTAFAYYEQDKITAEQEASYEQFKVEKKNQISKIENILLNFSDDADNRFVPSELIFQRNGDCALLFDDKKNQEDGIAVCIKPVFQILSQEEYL